ncbi:MAG: hypothetical protein ACK5RO_01980, partial [Pseudobdellovibrionaceae bacterium]
LHSFKRQRAGSKLPPIEGKKVTSFKNPVVTDTPNSTTQKQLREALQFEQGLRGDRYPKRDTYPALPRV